MILKQQNNLVKTILPASPPVYPSNAANTSLISEPRRFFSSVNRAIHQHNSMAGG